MLTYAIAKTKPKSFLALTSVHLEKFEFLLTSLAPRSDRYSCYHTWQAEKRQSPRYAPQADEELAEPADQLLFLLM